LCLYGAGYAPNLKTIYMNQLEIYSVFFLVRKAEKNWTDNMEPFPFEWIFGY